MNFNLKKLGAVDICLHSGLPEAQGLKKKKKLHKATRPDEYTQISKDLVMGTTYFSFFRFIFHKILGTMFVCF